MNSIRFWLTLLVLSATLCQCRKTKAITPEDYLPPETQFGAGTFACRINGKVWTYKDHNGGPFDLRPVSNWYYDPYQNEGHFSISAYKYENGRYIDNLGFYADSLSVNKIVYANATSSLFFIGYIRQPTGAINECEHYFTDTTVDKTPNFYRQGKLEVTRLDTQARIIAGRFNCTIYQTGCDTLKITDGRFDLKF